MALNVIHSVGNADILGKGHVYKMCIHFKNLNIKEHVLCYAVWLHLPQV